jgi:hypothetical protein
MSANPILIQHALNGGEVSTRMEGRQDQNKYLNSLKRCVNFIPLTVGGVFRRPGLQYMGEAKLSRTANDDVVVRTFKFSNEEVYILEVGHLYIRIWKDGVLLGGEHVTPYLGADLYEVFRHQSADVQYWTHRSYPVSTLSRIDDDPDTFVFTAVNFDAVATFEEEPTGFDLGQGTLTPAAVSGSGVNFTSSVAGFLAADVGRLIIYGVSRATIVSLSSTTVVVADITDNFPNTSPIPATDWRLFLSPQTTIDITDDRKDIGQAVTLTAAIDAFRATDVGKFVSLYGGTVQITGFTSATVVDGIIKATLKDITTSNPAATLAWTLEVAAWSDALGYPSCGCFYQERHYLCKGITVNGSKVNNFENFAKGGDDNDAIVRIISDDEVNPIHWIKGIRTLRIGTGSGSYEVTPTTQSGALTPTSFKIVPVVSVGSARIEPLRIGGKILYVPDSKRGLIQLGFVFADDEYKPVELFQLAEHLIDGFYLIDVAYAPYPDSIVYAVRNDGKLLALVYQEVQNTLGWSIIETDGEVTSVAVIPRTEIGKDWVWITVKRDIGGTTRTYLEAFETNAEGLQREWTELHTDAAAVRTHDADFLVTDLDHLEGKTVKVVGDGMIFSDRVVTDGEFTLSPRVAVNSVEVGLPYISDLLTLRPIIPPELGGPLIAKGWKKLGIFIRRALGLRLGVEDQFGEQLAFRKPVHFMDSQVPLQEGYKCINELGYSPFCRVRVQQRLPLPAEVLNIVGWLHVGDEWDCDTYNAPTTFTALPITCDSPCPVGQFARRVYNGSQNIGGPAIRVDPLSSEDSAFLVVAFYLPALERISIYWYNGESNEEFGTLLGSANVALTIGDVLEIRATPRIAGVIQYQAYVNGVSVVGPVGNADIPEDAACATFFMLTGLLATEFVTVNDVNVTVGGEDVTITTF